jgi:phenylalanyl-tRNA synthetase beta chain
MKFSEQWLRTWVNPQVSRDELVARLSMVGLEVDAVVPVAGEFSGVVVGEVVSSRAASRCRQVARVPGQQRQRNLSGGLRRAERSPGSEDPLRMIGAQLPGDFKIKKAKLRGVESNGMLCSETELQIGTDDSGLMELASDAPVGSDLRSIWVWTMRASR